MSVKRTNEELLDAWNSEKLSFKERDELLSTSELEQRNLYPRLWGKMDEWEESAGLYPDIDDPKFVTKLMKKQEFAENKQDSIADQAKQKINPCDPDNEFELTPVQRFIGRFLSPQCPYQSALLFHGVGVGKTCAGITVAENYLQMFPKRQVIIVAPRNIQPGFRRTIFDEEALIIPEQEGMPNIAKGCTGNTYLKRTGTELERDRAVITRRVTQSINSRYLFMGYIQFHRMIEDLLKHMPKPVDEQKQNNILRRAFSGRLVLIDEAHNLRDNPGESTDDNTDNPGGETEQAEAQAGKRLTPSLIKVLNASDGMKLLLMTGTPMYNSHKEIIFLLNLLLMNDKKATLTENDIFNAGEVGGFKVVKKKGGESNNVGEDKLGAAANAYVSFMRGENPLSFPVRLPPLDTPKIEAWPTFGPDAKPLWKDEAGRLKHEDEQERMRRLPFVPITFDESSLGEYMRISQEAIEAGGLGVGSIDEMVQAGNWLFPGEDGVQIRDAGFDSCFEDAGGGGASAFRSRKGPPTWLQTENLGKVSPKAKFTLERAQSAKGIIFVYSRFIKSGALPLALALEANGYSPWAEGRPLLKDGIQGGQGRQCAKCNRREKAHVGTGHKFVPAKYIIITGRSNISPNNPKAIQAARAKTNMDGGEIKFIIGSQVASEGIDFRFVREIYVFDSWFHLNKMEQVLGRGIRTCSHALLPPDQRNCTTYLLVNTFGGEEDTETADLYMYRKAMSKALLVGAVTRVLKQYALDCNLNRSAIVVAGLAEQRHVDAQGRVRDQVNVNDTPYTNLCDWIETCEYQCKRKVDINMDNLDESTYDDYSVRWMESKIKTAIKNIFQGTGKWTMRRHPIFKQWIAELEAGVSDYMTAVSKGEEVTAEVIDANVNELKERLKAKLAKQQWNTEIVDILPILTAPDIPVPDRVAATDGTTADKWVVLNKFREMKGGRDYNMKAEGFNPELLGEKATVAPVIGDISPPPKDLGQTVFTLEDIYEMFSQVPKRALSGLLSEIVGNQSFRFRVGKLNGYIVYRNKFFMFQPDYLSDIRIPLALRIAEVPVRKDHFEPAQYEKPAEKKVADAPVEEGVPAPAAEVAPAAPIHFWTAITKWAGEIENNTAESDDMPEYLRESIATRYTGDDAIFRENDQLIMINWLYSYIKNMPATEVSDENRMSYLKALARALLEMMWDENIRPNEQEQLFWGNDAKAKEVAKTEQVVKHSETSAFRIMDISTGTIKYKCGNGKACSEAVARIFDTDETNPVNTLQANINTTGRIYGFNVPKIKEGRMIFKTNERSVQPGQKPEKGSECSIVSTIAFHIRMLKEIAEILQAEKYPTFILVEKYLDMGKKGTAVDEAAKRRTGTYAMKGKKPFKTRSFENAIRACALKNIMLRWIDIMQSGAPGGKRYFYRPIGAFKSAHKGGK